jgi:hypothetical protein
VGVQISTSDGAGLRQKGVSDHTLLLLDTGTPSYTGIIKQFKMELSWFDHEDFRDRVIEIWNKPVSGQNSVQRWNRKLGALRRHLRGWLLTPMVPIKNKKNSLQSTIIALDNSRNTLAHGY